MKKNITRVLFGVAVIALGVIFLGNALGWWKISNFDGWWTMFLIIPGIASMITSGVCAWNVILTAVGVWLLIREQNWVSGRVLDAAFWAVVFILFGIWLIFGGRRRRKNPYPNSYVEGEQKKWNSNERVDFTDYPQYFAMFGGTKTSNCSKAFKGGSATAIFGGVELDLRNAELAGDATIDATAIFGGVDIFAPPNVRIEINGVPFLGGCENKARFTNDPNLPLLTVRYFAFCGGIDIK